jgi:hypothetical protein
LPDRRVDARGAWATIDGIVLVWVILIALFAPPFWESIPAEEWTDEQLEEILQSTPWVLEEDGARFFLASARPIWQAELERRRRHPDPEVVYEDDTMTEYFEFLEANHERYFVLAVHVPLPQYQEAEKRKRKMENKSVLVVNGKEYKMVGHFPPTPDDPYLRMIFPRVVSADDDAIAFELYVPGVPMPFRRLTFFPKSLTYKGEFEM